MLKINWRIYELENGWFSNFDATLWKCKASDQSLILTEMKW